MASEGQGQNHAPQEPGPQIPVQARENVDFNHLVSSEIGMWCQRDQHLDGQDRTLFHSSRIPNVSVRDYYKRIAKYSQCSPEAFMYSFVFLRRYHSITRRPVILRNVHRLAIVSVMVAAKIHDDIFFSNNYYASIGGLPNNELNDLELEFLKTLGYGTWVSVAEFSSTLDYLIEQYGALPPPPSPPPAGGSNEAQVK